MPDIVTGDCVESTGLFQRPVSLPASARGDRFASAAGTIPADLGGSPESEADVVEPRLNQKDSPSIRSMEFPDESGEVRHEHGPVVASAVRVGHLDELRSPAASPPASWSPRAELPSSPRRAALHALYTEVGFA